jgi:hypothetical protein
MMILEKASGLSLGNNQPFLTLYSDSHLHPVPLNCHSLVRRPQSFMRLAGLVAPLQFV